MAVMAATLAVALSRWHYRVVLSAAGPKTKAPKRWGKGLGGDQDRRPRDPYAGSLPHQPCSRGDNLAQVGSCGPDHRAEVACRFPVCHLKLCQAGVS